MKIAKVLAAVLFVDFLALNIWAFSSAGLSGLLAWFAAADIWSAVLMTDLCLALGVAVAWTWRDARQRGVSPLPYALLTAATGSLGPLLYVVRRK